MFTAVSTMARTRVCQLQYVYSRYECRATGWWQSHCQFHASCMSMCNVHTSISALVSLLSLTCTDCWIVMQFSWFLKNCDVCVWVHLMSKLRMLHTHKSRIFWQSQTIYICGLFVPVWTWHNFYHWTEVFVSIVLSDIDFLFLLLIWHGDGHYRQPYISSLRPKFSLSLYSYLRWCLRLFAHGEA